METCLNNNATTSGFEQQQLLLLPNMNLMMDENSAAAAATTATTLRMAKRQRDPVDEEHLLMVSFIQESEHSLAMINLSPPPYIFLYRSSS